MEQQNYFDQRRRDRWQQISRTLFIFLSAVTLILVAANLFISSKWLPVLLLLSFIILLANFIIYSVLRQTESGGHYQEIAELNHFFFPWFLLAYLLLLLFNYLGVFHPTAFFLDYVSFLIIFSGLAAVINWQKIKFFWRHHKK